MPDKFQYDVFLSHSAKDKRSKPPTLIHDTGGNAVVRPLAERLRADGVSVPKAEGKRQKNEIELHPSSFILHSLVEEGLERSRVLVLCMSANAFGSDWAQLESGTILKNQDYRI